LARPFWRRWLVALAKCDVILAAADNEAIDAFVHASHGQVPRGRIIQFTTRVDTTVFRPRDKMAAREELGIDKRVFLVATCGRISAVKGWKLLVDSFAVICRTIGNAVLVFVGDGEDRYALQKYCEAHGLHGEMRITGFLMPTDVAAWITAADVVAVPSYHEGWCTAMLEALACGKPVVSTSVSGAGTMVQDGENGFVVASRNSRQFADALMRTAALPSAHEIPLRIAREYAAEDLAAALGQHWKPLAAPAAPGV
jgi:teichuronic acid biosynthesis glycosyltransferase TuaC